MAAKNTETSCIYIPGANGLNAGSGVFVIFGTFNTSGGTTTGKIIPGYDANTGDSLLTEGSLNKCRGVRKILGCLPVNNANSNAFKAVISNNTTADGDQVDVICTVNDTFNYVLFGIDQGQTA